MEASIYAQPERRPSTDEVFSDSSKTGDRKQSDASDQVLRYQQEEPVAMPGKGEGSQTKYDVVKSTRDPTVRCVVQLLDGSDFETHVDPKCTGQMLLDKVCEHVNLLEKDYFCCTYMISPDVKVWIQNDRPLSKQIKKGKWNFAFDLKFYPQNPTALHEEITRYQVYMQLQKDIYLGRLPASFVTLALLGSYAVQLQIGDFDIDEHGPEIDYIKGKHFCPNQTEELLEKIAELHRTHSGQSLQEAEFHFLDNAKILALYGVHQHRALNEANEEVYVGICAAGLLIYRQCIRLGRYIWVKILKIAYKRNRFSIIVRADAGESKGAKTVEFRLANYKAAKRLWRLAVEHHTFFRRHSIKRGIETGEEQYQELQSTQANVSDVYATLTPQTSIKTELAQIDSETTKESKEENTKEKSSKRNVERCVYTDVTLAEKTTNDALEDGQKGTNYASLDFNEGATFPIYINCTQHSDLFGPIYAQPFNDIIYQNESSTGESFPIQSVKM